jgi:hypothetical protein
MLSQIFTQSLCDRLNNHLLKFAKGDRYLAQQQIFSNALMCFGGRSAIISRNLATKLTIFACLISNRNK